MVAMDFSGMESSCLDGILMALGLFCDGLCGCCKVLLGRAEQLEKQ